MDASAAPDFDDLHAQCLSDLTAALSLIERIAEMAPELQIEPRFKRVQDELTKVEALELRLAVVAPMNAGKSTLINSMLGRDLLPHRNSAMTTMPVEVVDESEVDEPELRVSPALRDALGKALREVGRVASQYSREEITVRLGRHPHLASLLDEGPPVDIAKAVHRGDAVYPALAYFNDIVRLLDNIEPQSPAIDALKSSPPPRLVAPEVGKAAAAGKLVLVDTPGPNEFGSAGLEAVVERELERASLVLLVLDFTQLHGEAAEALRKQVGAVRKIRGTDALFVVVNKVDQRRAEQDMSPEQVKRFVTESLGLHDVDVEHHLYETKALHALTAQLVLASGDRTGDAAKAMLRKITDGPMWPLIENADANMIAMVTQNYFNQSGLPQLRDGAVRTMREETGLRIVEQGDRLALGELQQALAALHTRRRALEVDASYVEKALSDLQEQLEQLPALKAQVEQTASAQRRRFVESLKRHSSELSRQIGQDLDKHFEPKSLLEKIKSRGREAGSDSVLEFRSKSEAERFTNSATRVAQDSVKQAMKVWSKRALGDLGRTKRELERDVRGQLRPVITAAQKSMAENLRLNVGWPTAIPKSAVAPLEFAPKPKENIKKGRPARKEKRYRIDFLGIKLFEYEVEVSPATKDKRWTTYRVDLATLKRSVSVWKDEQIASLESAVDDWVSSELEASLEKLVSETEHFLRRYESTLQASLADKLKSHQEQEARIQELNDLSSQVHDVCGSLRSRTEAASTINLG